MSSSAAQESEPKGSSKRIWIVIALVVVLGGFFVADWLGIGRPICTSRDVGKRTPGQRCSIQGEIVPLAEGQRELGTLQRASVLGDGTKYNQFNLRDDAGVVTIHFVSAEVMLPPTGRRVKVDVETAEVIAGAKVLVAEDWDFVE